MGLQKYRADIKGEKQKNGGTPFYTKWGFGPSLALIRDCVVTNIGFSAEGGGGGNLPPRTVYVRGECDTFFSQPAACQWKGKTITGYITPDDNGELIFRAHNSQKEKVA